MRFDPRNPHYRNNDRFILSKGHAAPLLYAVWAELGAFPVEELTKLRRMDSDLEGHPTPRLPFVDVTTGSLGQGLSVGVGMQFGARVDQLDLRTYVLDRGVEEAYELVEEIVRKLKWKIASSDPPTVKPLKGGVLEATDLTPVIGFPDDVIIRVEGSATRSRIDLRSSSRFGVADGGQNATRVRKFLAELQSRTDASGAPIMAGRRGWRSAKRGAPVKKVKGGDPQKVESRNKRDRAQSSAQRGRGQKETLR